MTTDPARASRRGRRSAMTLGAAVLVLSAATPALSAEPACRASLLAGSSTDVPTLSVSVRAERPSYRRGQVALVLVEVHDGTPSGPVVGGADLTIAVSRYGREVRTIGSRTRADGTSQIRLRLNGELRPGTLTATADARSILIPGTDCEPGVVYQVGRGIADPLMTVSG